MKETCNNCPPDTSIRKILYSFLINREKYTFEWKLIRYNFISIMILIMLIEILAFTFWKNNTTYLKQLPWIIYLIITISIILSAVNHIRSHTVLKTTISSMTGMMIGMILGMQSGVMLSVIIGSTNGMFMGSIFGIIFGVTIGIYTGRCGGLIGILNGALMGIMGGTMGPMIALMMKVDHILWFMPLFTLLNILIILGLNFLVYEELIEKLNEKQTREHTEIKFLPFFVNNLIITTFFIIIIVFGYTSTFAAL